MRRRKAIREKEKPVRKGGQVGDARKGYGIDGLGFFFVPLEL